MGTLRLTAVSSLESELSRHFTGYISSRRHGRSPSPLKVVAAQPARYVDDLSNKIQARTLSALHTLARQLFCVHPAGCNFSFLISFSARGKNLPTMKCFFE